jgi:hypothetical protein
MDGLDHIRIARAKNVLHITDWYKYGKLIISEKKEVQLGTNEKSVETGERRVCLES